MQYVFLCHAPADAADARDLGRWLAINTPCEIRLSECGAGCDHDLVEAADQSMSAEAVILLLSPESVPGKWVRSRWEPVLIGQPAEEAAAVACVLIRECKFPELLRRRNFFHPDQAGRRALKRWLLARFPSVVSVPAADVPEVEVSAIEDLRSRLADQPGAAAGIPRDLALAFAGRCAGDFEGVFWVDGTRRTPTGIAADLAHAAGLTLPGPPDECAGRLREFCGARRLLLVFDNCSRPLFDSTGKCSVLSTAPHPGLAPRPLEELARNFAQWTRSADECLAALRDVAPAIKRHTWHEVSGLAYSAVAVLRHRERAAELLELVEVLLPRAAAAGDDSAVRHFEWERSWILQAWGRAEPVAAPLLPPPPGDQLSLPFPVGS